MPSHTELSKSEFKRFAGEHRDLAYLDAFILDVNGNAVGKRLPWAEAATVFQNGIAFSACAPLFDCQGRGHDAGGLGGSDGDPDGIALPLEGMLVPVPWSKASTAQVMCSMAEYGTETPLWFDPRIILRDLILRCHQQGFRPVVACELEFYLVDSVRTDSGRLRPAMHSRTQASPSRPANLSLESIEEQSSFLADVTEAAAAQGIPVTGLVSEYGLGQFEVNLQHVADPLVAADHACLLRRLIKGVARASGHDATFMAKPFKDQPGNGLHVHMSLVDERGENYFAGADGEPLLHQAIAGMQALMFDSMALFAPNINSYRRYLGPFVPNTTAWGHNNRSVAFRIPAAGGASTRIEHRVAGADASPHLVVAAILAAVLHGVGQKLQPTSPAAGRAQRGRDSCFPRGLWAALEGLTKSAVLPDYIPGRYLEIYADLKRGEFETLLDDISARELDFYA